MFIRTSLFAVVLLALCAGCGSNPTAKLVGKWEAEIAPPADDASSFAERLQSAFAALLKINLDFRPDGTLTFAMSVPGHDQVSEGTWKYLKSEGDTLVLEVVRDNSSSVTRVKVVDDDHIELIRPGGTFVQSNETLKFKRVTAPAATSQ